MAKKVLITASIFIERGEEQYSNKEYARHILSKNFAKTEISNIHSIDEFICFKVNSVLAVPTLILYFPTLQLFVNNNMVNMKNFK